MYVSFHMSPQSRGPSEDIATIEELVDAVRMADAAGIASVCLTEHHLGGFNTYTDPFVLGAYLAPQIEQTYIAITVVQVPLAHPVRIAEHANMLDLMTRGRVMLALAPGSTRELELDAFGVELAQRSAMTNQRIDAMLRAWAWSDDTSPVDVSTDFDQGRIDARISPSSFRKPHPLIGRATLTEATIADTARRGWPVLLALRDLTDDANERQIAVYKEALFAAEHDEPTVRDCLSWLGFITQISIAETEREANRRKADYIELGGGGPIVTNPREGTPEWVAEWRTRQLHKSNIAFAGTPQMIVEHLGEVYEGLDVEHARVSFLDIPGRAEQNKECYQLFIEEVLPHLNPQRLPDPEATIEHVGVGR